MDNTAERADRPATGGSPAAAAAAAGVEEAPSLHTHQIHWPVAGAVEIGFLFVDFERDEATKV